MRPIKYQPVVDAALASIDTRTIRSDQRKFDAIETICRGIGGMYVTLEPYARQIGLYSSETSIIESSPALNVWYRIAYDH